MNEVFAAIVPGWRGRALPPSFPRIVRALLGASTAILFFAAVLRHQRPFTALAPDQREALLEHLAHHRLAPIRGLVQWWKLLALILRE